MSTPTLGIVVAGVGEGGGARRGREAEAAILHRDEAADARARQQRRSDMLPTGDYFFDLHQPSSLQPKIFSVLQLRNGKLGPDHRTGVVNSHITARMVNGLNCCQSGWEVRPVNQPIGLVTISKPDRNLTLFSFVLAISSF